MTLVLNPGRSVRTDDPFVNLPGRSIQAAPI